MKTMTQSLTPFQLVCRMNTAFGNQAGNPSDIGSERVLKQCLNIPDEVGELFIALGAEPTAVKAAVASLKEAAKMRINAPSLSLFRDSLCDINVFSNGAHHFVGIDGDRDMESVVSGVMTRFIKDDADKEATIAMHAARGVSEVYFEGEYPTMIMKSAVDQPDAPKGKFLKSASFSEPAFYSVDETPAPRGSAPRM